MRTRSFRSTPDGRDRYRLSVVAVTGVAMAASLTATGWVVGVAAAEFEAEKAERDAVRAEADRERARYERRVARARSARQPALRQRPSRTRVTTRYVTGGSPASLGGGSLTAPVGDSSGTSGSGSGSAGGSGGSSSGTSSSAPPPPPPPAPPPPPTTSGS